MNAHREPPLFGVSMRQKPASIEAEQTLLAGILSSSKAFDAVGEFLRPHHFSHPLHGRLYGECAKRIVAGHGVDYISMRPWFEGQPEAADVGQEYFGKLMGAFAGLLGCAEYGRAIYEAWQRRRLIDIGEEAVSTAFALEGSPAEIVTKALSEIDAVMATCADRAAVSLDDAMDDVIRAADEAMHRSGPAGVSTGMRAVDDALGGLEPGTLTLLAGRPGMGKSALAIGWALSCARAGNPVTIFSLEMSARSLGRRLLSAASNVPVIDIKRGYLTEIQIGRLVVARKELAGLPLTIEDGSGLTPTTIGLKARMAKRRRGLALLIVDHMHIVKPEAADVKAGATWAVGQVCLSLQQIAKSLDVPVLALAQLNRGVEGREDKRPTKADLRQAGDLEQNADAICFVYRPEYYLGKAAPERKDGEREEQHAVRVDDWIQRKREQAGKAELIFDKVRDGAECVVNLIWQAETTSFSEVSF